LSNVTIILSNQNLTDYLFLILPNCIEGKGKEYFCCGNLRFFINDKQKIITHKSPDGSGMLLTAGRMRILLRPRQN